MNIGDYIKIDPNTVKGNRPRNPLTIKIMNLEVGDGFEVENIERSEIQGAFVTAKKNTHKVFKASKRGPFKYLVYRTE